MMKKPEINFKQKNINLFEINKSPDLIQATFT